MNTWVNVARYHLMRRTEYLVLPWAILAFNLVVTLVILMLVPAGHHVTTSHGQVLRVYTSRHYGSGSMAVIYIFSFIMGVLTIGRSLPFGLALGISRRTYYIGTALLAVILAATYGLALTILQAIERATYGWGLDARVFQVPYVLAGPWYLTWLTSFVGLALLFGYGMWFGIVHRRWNLAGTMAFIAAQVTVLLAAALLITRARAWPATGHFFAALSETGLTGLLAMVTVALLIGGYVTISRVTI